MIEYHVNDMTCGHCASTITKAVQEAVPGAKILIDLDTHKVQVEAAADSRQAVENAIREAGYTPER